MPVHRLALIAMSLMLGMHAAVVGCMLRSFFFIAAFSWGFVLVTVLAGRLEAAKAMAATMTLLLLLSVVALKLTPLGRGSLTALFSLALVPSLVAWACVFGYVVHVQRAEAAREIPFSALLTRMSTRRS